MNNVSKEFLVYPTFSTSQNEWNPFPSLIVNVKNSQSISWRSWALWNSWVVEIPFLCIPLSFGVTDILPQNDIFQLHFIDAPKHFHLNTQNSIPCNKLQHFKSQNINQNSKKFVKTETNWCIFNWSECKYKQCHHLLPGRIPLKSISHTLQIKLVIDR